MTLEVPTDSVAVRSRAHVDARIVLKVPGDKAISQRATILAFLANGASTIHGLSPCEDVESNLAAIETLGCLVVRAEGAVTIMGSGLHGMSAPGRPVHVGNSATTARLLMACLAGQELNQVVIAGNELLGRRPMGWVARPLARMGAKVEFGAGVDRLPVAITGRRPLRAITITTEVYSAQAKSALLLAALLADGPSEITGLTAARDHTERLMGHFGVTLEVDGTTTVIQPPASIEGRPVVVPGDISSASFLIAATVLPRQHEVVLTVEDVGVNPTRTGFVTALQEMGAHVAVTDVRVVSGEPVGTVTVRSGARLHGIAVEGNERAQSLIDEIPLLACVAAFAEGSTSFHDCGELVGKDTDRILTTARGLRAFSANVSTSDDGLVVTGGARLRPSVASGGGDHRVSMALCVLASVFPEISVIHGARCVNVSFPLFFTYLRQFADVREAFSQAS